MPLDRRHFLLGAAATPLLAGCAGFSTSESDDTGSEAVLTFTTWGTDAELAGLESAIASFEEAEGVRVELNAVPYDQMFTNIDAQLQTGSPPDIFRVPYYLFGSYAGRGQLLDLGPHLASDVPEQFTEAAWAAVQSEGSPFGVPHHTDTTAILYDVAAMDAAVGPNAVPTSLEEAWTWEEFGDVARALAQTLDADRYPFAYNWQGNGVTRWLTWLFEADGRFLTEDLTAAAIDSDAGRRAVEFTSSFFTEGWVPPTNSIRSSTYAADSWFAGTVPMVFAGAFLVPDAEATYQREWAVTYPPRDVRSASDFGGNALVATADADPELAAAFLSHVTTTEAMQTFCEGASLLPTRRDLLDGGIEFDVRPEVTEVFVNQASAVLPQDSGQVASPNMAAIISVLQAGLEGAFAEGVDVETTIAELADGIDGAVG